LALRICLYRRRKALQGLHSGYGLADGCLLFLWIIAVDIMGRTA
jgi:hypothetical protein